MLNDLKEKFAAKLDSGSEEPTESKFAAITSRFEQFDKKRVYTAFVALVVAGAAGHFMQRTAGGATQQPILAASVQSAPSAGAAVGMSAEFTASESASESASQIDDVMAHVVVPADTPVTEITDVAALEAPAAEQPAGARDDVAQDPIAAPDSAPVAQASEEVTRAAAPDLPVDDRALSTFASESVATDASTDAADVTDFAALTEETQVPGMPTPNAEPAISACEIHMSAAPLPGALIALSVDAPCNAAEDVDFIQDGLRFSEQLGPDGSLDVMVPAMSDFASVKATFEDGSQKFAEASVPDFGAFERVAVVWKGATGLQLHALENGASYGEPGHVWAETPALPAIAIDGKGGFISVLGSTADGYAADVYTYPASMSGSVEPDVSIEAQVMENTCGQKIEGVILRSNAGRAPTITDLSMAVPQCDAVGEYLVLKNLPQELKIARN